MKKLATIVTLGLTLFLFMAPLSYANNGKVTHTFDLGGIENVVINNAVGEVTLRTSSSNEAKVEVTFEVKGRGFFRRKPDVDNLDIETWQHNSTLALSFKENNVNAAWVITLPAVTNIEIQQGVGTINAVIGASHLTVDLGVGDIKVTAPLASVGKVDVSSGVGAARISGSDKVETRRRVVTESADLRLDGEFNIDATVGVGDVEVRLR